MRQLPDRPDLDQLRHQARDLKRAAERGDPDAVRRLESISRGITLAASQLAIAREYRFASWQRMKVELEGRATAAATAVAANPAAQCVIRPVTSTAELAVTFDVIGAQMTPRMMRDDRRFQAEARRFDEDRTLMLVVEDRGGIVGGALAFRPGGGGITVRAIGLDPQFRRKGLGRRLMTAIELEAIRLGAGGINLGSNAESKGFYERLGYAGRGTMMHKGLPLPGRFLEARLRKMSL